LERITPTSSTLCSIRHRRNESWRARNKLKKRGRRTRALSTQDRGQVTDKISSMVI
jgi:hypothetical protein